MIDFYPRAIWLCFRGFYEDLLYVPRAAFIEATSIRVKGAQAIGRGCLKEFLPYLSTKRYPSISWVVG